MGESATPLSGLSSWRALIALWCALWVVVGAWTGYEVWPLSALSRTVADSGRALDEEGSALQSLGQLPVVGTATERLGDQARGNAAQIVTGAGDAGGSIRRLSLLLGLTIALVPSVPAVAGYLTVAALGRPSAER